MVWAALFSYTHNDVGTKVFLTLASHIIKDLTGDKQ